MRSRIFFSLTIAMMLSGAPLPSIAQTQPGGQNGPIHLFNGSADEQAACNADAGKLCGAAAADAAKALTCLKNFRRRLSAACDKALNQHGL